MIKNIVKFLTLKVEFSNLLGSCKYKKQVKLQKKDICVLGISKL